MGRTIKSELNEQQRAELETGFRNGKAHSFRLCCQMVLLKAGDRKSQEVAAILGTCEQTVNGWLWHYKNKGINGL
jgi:hypothetical protein